MTYLHARDLNHVHVNRWADALHRMVEMKDHAEILPGNLPHPAQGRINR